jgi:hypothetical protein
MTEPTRWNTMVTRELVGRRYGAEQAARIRPVLRAVNVRLHHVAMHYDALRAVTTRNLDDPIGKGKLPFELMFVNEGEPGANNLFFLECEMQLFGAIQALHAVADNLAHVLHYGLGWNLADKPRKDRVSFKSVLNRLREPANGSDVNLAAVLECLNELKQAPSFKMLEAAANHIKHHGGLHATVSWEPSTDRPYELRLSEFERSDVKYPQQEAVAFLKQTHLVMSQAVIRTGCALNVWLQEAAGSTHPNQTPEVTNAL